MALTNCIKKTNFDTLHVNSQFNADAHSDVNSNKNIGKNNKNTEGVEFGFNEWIKAQNGEPKGQNWQTWSAAMYLYAAKCVEERRTPFFDLMRQPK